MDLSHCPKNFRIFCHLGGTNSWNLYDPVAQIPGFLPFCAIRIFFWRLDRIFPEIPGIFVLGFFFVFLSTQREGSSVDFCGQHPTPSVETLSVCSQFETS